MLQELRVIDSQPIKGWKEYHKKVDEYPVHGWFRWSSVHGEAPEMRPWNRPYIRNIIGYSLEDLHGLVDDDDGGKYKRYAPLNQAHPINIHLDGYEMGAVVTLDFIRRHLPTGSSPNDLLHKPNVFCIKWLEAFNEAHTVGGPGFDWGPHRKCHPMRFVGRASLKWNFIHFGDDGKPIQPLQFFTFATQAWITLDDLGNPGAPVPTDMVIGTVGNKLGTLDEQSYCDRGGMLLGVAFRVKEPGSKNSESIPVKLSPPTFWQEEWVNHTNEQFEWDSEETVVPGPSQPAPDTMDLDDIPQTRKPVPSPIRSRARARKFRIEANDEVAEDNDDFDFNAPIPKPRT